MREEILRLERVTCREQGVVQLENFNLQIFRGEIMGLLAVNSHGLNTLIGLLRRRLPLDRGYVYYRERQINAWGSQIPDRTLQRIGIIENRSSLVSGMTVADNIFVLRPSFKSWLIRPSLLHTQLKPVLEQLGADFSPDDYVDRLTPFQRFVVEMLKAVLGGCRLIVLREVSTFISDADLSRLHAIIRKFAQEGISFLYIGYHFEELREICDRTALLMNGMIPKVLLRGEPLFPCGEPYHQLVRGQMEREESTGPTEKAAFRARHVTGGKVHDLSFSVQPGECVVLQDLNNQIFGDLLDLLTGQLSMEKGNFEMDGKPFVPGYTREIAILLEHAHDSMLIKEMSVLDNLCFTLDHRLPEVWRSNRLRRGIERECGELLESELFSLWPDQLTTPQKYDLIYTRVLLQKPKVIFCVQPFQGADMELRMRIWNHLKRLQEQGTALVILAVNLADSLSLAHQLLRIRRDGPHEYYGREDVSHLSDSTPWANFYQHFQI